VNHPANSRPCAYCLQLILYANLWLIKLFLFLFMTSTKKLLKEFCRSLVESSASEEPAWEPQEIARLAILVTRQLHLSAAKTVKFLLRLDVLTPQVLACLEDAGVQFSTQQKLQLLWVDASRDVEAPQQDRFERTLARLDDALEQGILDLSRSRNSLGDDVVNEVSESTH
jgi:hypothetical protein